MVTWLLTFVCCLRVGAELVYAAPRPRGASPVATSLLTFVCCPRVGAEYIYMLPPDLIEPYIFMLSPCRRGTRARSASPMRSITSRIGGAATGPSTRYVDQAEVQLTEMSASGGAPRHVRVLLCFFEVKRIENWRFPCEIELCISRIDLTRFQTCRYHVQ